MSSLPASLNGIKYQFALETNLACPSFSDVCTFIRVTILYPKQLCFFSWMLKCIGFSAFLCNISPSLTRPNKHMTNKYPTAFVVLQNWTKSSCFCLCCRIIKWIHLLANASPFHTFLLCRGETCFCFSRDVTTCSRPSKNEFLSLPQSFHIYSLRTTHSHCTGLMIKLLFDIYIRLCKMALKSVSEITLLRCYSFFRILSVFFPLKNKNVIS